MSLHFFVLLFLNDLWTPGWANFLMPSVWTLLAIAVGYVRTSRKAKKTIKKLDDLNARHDTLEANHREILWHLRGRRGQLGNEGAASDSDQPSGQDRADADTR